LALLPSRARGADASHNFDENASDAGNLLRSGAACLAQAAVSINPETGTARKQNAAALVPSNRTPMKPRRDVCYSTAHACASTIAASRDTFFNATIDSVMVDKKP
jgi:hypothetical protein